MTNEEKLAEALRRYPIGTKVKCAYDDELMTVLEPTIDGDDVMSCNDLDNSEGWVFLYLHRKGKWAEVVGWEEVVPRIVPTTKKKTEDEMNEDIAIIMSNHESSMRVGNDEVVEEIVKYIKSLL